MLGQTMGRLINRLSARKIETITKPGLYADGAGLYLSTKTGGKRWLFVFRWQGKRTEMGLGSARAVSLARARELAADARGHLAAGLNPIAARDAERAAALAETQAALTFGKFADEHIASVEAGFRNAKHQEQYRHSVRVHAHALRDKALAEINTDDVLEVLQPIWLKFPTTANRLRGRIEKILNAAKARGLRERDSINPAQWRGHLDVLLPKQPKMVRGHHPAMPYSEVPAFMRRLSDRSAMSARALEFLILNAARTGEVLRARWGEINGDIWTIPGDRMKAGISHNVTLSSAAIAVLDGLGRGKDDEYIFPAKVRGRPLSNMAMATLLQRMKCDQYTVHGFRSAFKDWSIDCTEVPDEISEEALAHIVGNSVRRAYRRGEALERRRKLMQAWAEYLGSQPLLTVVRNKAA